MEHLWTPWRSTYVAGTDRPQEGQCLFCIAAERPDAENYILHRGHYTFVMLNLFPYTSGHLMIAPFAHVSRLQAMEQAARIEMMDLACQCERILESVYHPEGLNLGMNLGEAAGAGIAGHLHLHVLPRWTGDANFMTTVGQTRVMPESIAQTYERLRPAFRTEP
jgi:ATP adenylyltransferase